MTQLGGCTEMAAVILTNAQASIFINARAVTVLGPAQ